MENENIHNKMTYEIACMHSQLGKGNKLEDFEIYSETIESIGDYKKDIFNVWRKEKDEKIKNVVLELLYPVHNFSDDLIAGFGARKEEKRRLSEINEGLIVYRDNTLIDFIPFKNYEREIDN